MSTHINAKDGEVADRVLLPGDPLRAKFIAENFLENPVCYNEVRGMYGFTGTYKGKKVSVQGSGMGQPSLSIYVNELFQFYGVQKIIRVGTIGAVFDFFAGTVERAPEWWQQHGLEWLYRLMKEPKRMWRRYIIGNTLFLWNMLKESSGKNVLLLLMLLTFATNMSAKSLNELWVSMPDSLMPMVNKSQRIEFLDLKNLGVKAEVDNLLGESCQLDSVTSDYLKLTTSPSSLYEMRLLPQTSGDSLLCIVRTFSAPEKESELKFYDQEWKELEGTSLLPSNLSDVSLYMQAKPDTMSLERYHELQAMIEPQMFHLTWSEDGNELVSQLSLPLLGKEEKAQMLALLMQRKFKWDGEKFKEI